MIVRRIPLGTELTPSGVVNAIEIALAYGSHLRMFEEGAEKAIAGAEATMGEARWAMIVRQHDINIDKDVYMVRLLVDDEPSKP